MLKSIEGTGKLLSIKLKEMLMHSTGTKLAALLLKGQLGDFKKMLDANEVGGTALLGISKPVVKAHGSASEVGICNASVRRWRSRAAVSSTTSRKISTRCVLNRRQNNANAKKRQNGY